MRKEEQHFLAKQFQIESAEEIRGEETITRTLQQVQLTRFTDES
jgi:hypothetical protein